MLRRVSAHLSCSGGENKNKNKNKNIHVQHIPGAFERLEGSQGKRIEGSWVESYRQKLAAFPEKAKLPPLEEHTVVQSIETDIEKTDFDKEATGNEAADKIWEVINSVSAGNCKVLCLG